MSRELDELPNWDELKEEYKEIQQEQRAERRKDQNNNRQVKLLQQRERKIREDIRTVEYHLQRLQAVDSRKLQTIFGNCHQSNRWFYEWVDKNKHEFKGNIYGPIAKYLDIRSGLHCMYLENCIGRGTLLAYVVENKDDWVLLNRQLGEFQQQNTQFKGIKIIHQDARQQLNKEARRCSRAVLQQCGIDGFLDDVVDAPDLVKLVLNNMSNLYRIGYTDRDPTARQLEAILRKNKNEVNVLDALYTPSNNVSVRISRYGNNDTITNYSPIHSFGRSSIVTQFVDNQPQVCLF